tara:strand:+ start:1215 stop:1580 length:366 start_codon:yes stop_codon:yes gene_type:complete
MGIKRRAMFSPKFKNVRPQRYEMGQKMRQQNQADNSAAQEQLKQMTQPEPEVATAPEVVEENFTPEIVEEMVKEVETMVDELNTIAPEPVLEKPKPKTRTRRRRTTVKKTATTRKNKVEKN